MCVIIYIPTGEKISKDELKQAWETNPDGAGYAYLINGQVMYHRGFMQFSPFYDEIRSKIGKNPLLLHFRISTSRTINKTQTHPYKKTDIKKLKGVTEAPVICMNGTISGQTCYKHYNDTMSYIQDNGEAFKIIADHQSQNLLNIVEEATGSRWAIATPAGVLLSKGFIWEDGKAYSNTNHKYTIYYYTGKKKRKKTIKNMIPKQLYKQLKKDPYLYYQVADHIEFLCDSGICLSCLTCLKQAQNLKDIEQTITWGKYY